MTTRTALEAKLAHAFTEGDYELIAQLQEEISDLKDEQQTSSAPPEEDWPLTIDAQLRKAAAMMKTNYDVGRETMQVNITHGNAIPRSATDRMTQLKHWLKKIDQALATKNSPLFKILADTSRQVCDKCATLLEDVPPFHWANKLTKNTAKVYCSSEACGFLCPECEKRVHSEQVSGCAKTLGETNGHRTFNFSNQAVSLNSMDCSSLDDVTQLCAAWLSKLEERKKQILELGAQLASLSRQVENSLQYRCCVTDAKWSADHPHSTDSQSMSPSENESYSFVFCNTNRNVRTVIAVTTKLNVIACGRDTRLPIRWIFNYCGGDLKCADGVITTEELARAFKQVAPLLRSETDPVHPQRQRTVASRMRDSTGRAPLKLHTMITRGFDRVASSDISQLKKIKVMLVGMVNAGKSSFLNVLLGLDKEIHFPTNESSWTRMITKLKYGPTKTWCLRTTDEKEERVTEHWHFNLSDPRRSSRILNALCAYGRDKYDTRPKWLDQLPRHEIDQVLNMLASADEEPARAVQQKYAVSDADMDVTMQWLNGDTRMSMEDSTTLGEVSLLKDFKNKFLSERRVVVRFTSRPMHPGLLRAQGLYRLHEKRHSGQPAVLINEHKTWVAQAGRYGWEFRYTARNKAKWKSPSCLGCRVNFNKLVYRRQTCGYCMRSVCVQCSRINEAKLRICVECENTIRSIEGELDYEQRPVTNTWQASKQKKQKAIGDLLPPIAKVPNMQSDADAPPAVDLHVYEYIAHGTSYVPYSVQAPVAVDKPTIVVMQVDGRLMQIPVPPMPINHTFYFVPTDAMLHGDVLMCTREQPSTQHSSPVDCEWPAGVDVRCSDGQRANMSDADILGYLLQEQLVYIELTFPAPILRKGLVLIDSPGVGEATRLRERPLTNFVITEAQKADAFVYVLDAKRGTPTEEDGRTLIALLGYRNQTSRLDVEAFLEDNPMAGLSRQRYRSKSSKSAYFIMNKIDQVAEDQSIHDFHTTLRDVLTSNQLVSEDAARSKSFSLSCKAELQLQRRGQHTTQDFIRFRSCLVEQICLDKKQHVLCAINELHEKVLQLSEYFNTNRQEAERNYADLPEFSARAKRVVKRLRADLIFVKEEWKQCLRPALVDLVEKHWRNWGDVNRIVISLGPDIIKSREKIQNLAQDIAADIYTQFAKLSRKHMRAAVENLLGLMVNKFEKTAQELKQPLLKHQVRNLQQALIDHFLDRLYSPQYGDPSTAWGGIITGLVIGGVAWVSGMGGLAAGVFTAASASALTMNPVGWVVAGFLFVTGGTMAAVSGVLLKFRSKINDKSIKKVADRVKTSMISKNLSKGKVKITCLVDEIIAHCDSTCVQVIDTLVLQFEDMVSDHIEHIKMRLNIRDIGDLDAKLRRHIKKLNKMRMEANVLAPDTLLARPWFTTTTQKPFALCRLFENLKYQQRKRYKFATVYDIGSETHVNPAPINRAVDDRRRRLMQQVTKMFSSAADQYEITRVDLLQNRDLRQGFDYKVRILEHRRADNSRLSTGPFNAKVVDDGVKLNHLAHMKKMFLHNSALEHANLMLMWHGCDMRNIEKICDNGCADLARRDKGFFGRGIYCTPEAEYAAYYSTIGEPVDGEYVMLLNVVVVALTYVISRKTDYLDASGKPTMFSRFHGQQAGGMALACNGFDSHFAAVSKRELYQADDNHPQFHELVLKEESQVMPFCRVYFRKRESK